MNEIIIPGELIAYITANPTDADGIRNKITLYVSGVASEAFNGGYTAATEEAEKRFREIANHAHDAIQLVTAAGASHLLKQDFPF